MSRKYTRYTEKVERKRIISVICDRCGATIPGPGIYEVREFRLEFSIGYSYPDSGNREGWEVEDLCDACVEWLHLLLREEVIISKLEVDW